MPENWTSFKYLFQNEEQRVKEGGGETHSTTWRFTLSQTSLPESLGVTECILSLLFLTRSAQDRTDALAQHTRDFFFYLLRKNVRQNLTFISLPFLLWRHVFPLVAMNVWVLRCIDFVWGGEDGKKSETITRLISAPDHDVGYTCIGLCCTNSNVSVWGRCYLYWLGRKPTRQIDYMFT